MAGRSGNQFTPPSYLSPDQQDLLLAALQSNNPNRKNMANAFQNGQFSNSFGLTGQFDANTMDPLMYTPGNTGMSMANFDTLDATLNDSPFMDFLDNNDANLDFDISGSNGQVVDVEEVGDDDYNEDIHDKRKTPEDGKDDEDEDPKRHEPDEKVAKKPGRKPLTTEPTSVSSSSRPSSSTNINSQQKRKAQNRAAQRAFRERKEKHLKDLETKVAELEKASESANHENGLLRAQVERLQMELREYRKRLSMQAGGLGRSPPFGQGLTSYFASNANGSSNSNFQFEFPKFGSLPGGVFNNGAAKANSPPSANGIANGVSSNMAPGVLNRHDSQGRSMSPRSQTRANGSVSSANSPPQLNGSGSVNGHNGGIQIESLNNERLAGLFGTSALNGTNSLKDTPNSTDMFNKSGASPQQSTSTSDHSSIDKSRIFQFNSNATSTGSPSTSSVSQYGGANSSCGTSPEPSHNSPANHNKDQVNEHGYVCRSGSDGEISFCEKLNMACGNPRNPIPRAMSASGKSRSNGASAQTTPNAGAATIATDANANGDSLQKGIDYFASQNGGQFDPVLFGDYRDSQAAIVGDGDFTGGFFNDALPSAIADFGSPFNWDTNMSTGLTPAVQKPNPMEEAIKHADAIADGNDEEVVPGDDLGNMLTCHKIWYVSPGDCIEDEFPSIFDPLESLCQDGTHSPVLWAEEAPEASTSGSTLLPDELAVEPTEYYAWAAPTGSFGWVEEAPEEYLPLAFSPFDTLPPLHHSFTSAFQYPPPPIPSPPRPEDPEAFGPCRGIASLGSENCLLTSPTGTNFKTTKTSKTVTLTSMGFAAN